MTPFKLQRSIIQSFRGFCADRKGVSAIEFALVLPVLLMMYIGTMELGQAIETNKKVSRAASMVGDLVTQEQQVSNTDLTSVMRIGESILQPYQRTRPTITIAGIQFNSATPPVGQIVWQQRQDGSANTNCPVPAVADVPASLRTKNSFVVRVQTCLHYLPVIAWDTSALSRTLGFTAAAGFEIPMQETYFYRARMSDKVACNGCS
jgi:Flp pilus assembly protein TadG